jgi:hypothetical protein
MRHLIERIFPMLQWNSKFAVVVLVAVSVAAMLAGFHGFHGFGNGGGLNFTW